MKHNILLTTLGIILFILFFLCLLVDLFIHYIYQSVGSIPDFPTVFSLLALFLTEGLLFTSIIIIFRKKLIPFIRHYKTTIIIFFICLFVLTLLSQKIYLFDGVNLIGLNCGSAQISLDPTDNMQQSIINDCLLHSFHQCIPTHALYANTGIDTSFQENISVTKRNGNCLLIDKINKTGMTINNNGNSNLTCTDITGSSQQITLNCGDTTITIP